MSCYARVFCYAVCVVLITMSVAHAETLHVWVDSNNGPKHMPGGGMASVQQSGEFSLGLESNHSLFFCTAKTSISCHGQILDLEQPACSVSQNSCADAMPEFGLGGKTPYVVVKGTPVKETLFEDLRQKRVQLELDWE